MKVYEESREAMRKNGEIILSNFNDTFMSHYSKALYGWLCHCAVLLNMPLSHVNEYE